MRRRFRFTTLGVLDALFVLSVIYVTIWALHPNLLFSSSLITGGDTGSHLAGPAYLRTTGNPFNFTPWYPGWLDGIPLYTYYFVLPDALVTLASYVINFAVAMKIGTIVGSVLMPVAAYLMGRLFKAPRPIPVALAVATLPFLFDASFTIDGGNLFSTMAGEYAFSLSLALALVTIGLFARGVRTGRGYWLAAISLSATLAAHVLPWMFSLGAIAVVVVMELLWRRGIGEPREASSPRHGPHPAVVGLALVVLALWPVFFDVSFWTSRSAAFATRGGFDSLLVSIALALLTVALYAGGRRVGGPRGYWLVVVAAIATVASMFVTLRAGLGALVVVVALALLRRHDASPSRRAQRGDYARPVRFAVGAGLLSLGLSAWWLFPFATSQSLTDSLGYTNISVATLRSIFSTLGWYNATGGAAGDRWVIVTCAVAIVVAFAVRDRLGMTLGAVTVLSFWAFVLDPQSAIWNQRLIPFWFIAIHLCAGWLVGYVAWRLVDRAPVRQLWRTYLVEGATFEHVPYDAGSAERSAANSPHEVAATREVLAVSRGVPDAPDAPATPQGVASVAERDDSGAPPLGGGEGASRRTGRVFAATVVVGLLGLLSTVPGQITSVANDLHLATGGNQVSSWAQWNYSGYQGKAAWPEYHDIITTMSRVAKRYGCGRAMWEYNASENRFGTPEALMLLPYWTDNCVDSEEGLLMESSPTTPYHYLDQSELSIAPSDPQVGLDYGPLDVAQGVRHLQMLGVKYFFAFSPQVIAEANADPDLKLVATTKAFPAPGAKWYFYLVKDSPIVQPLAHVPVVLAGVASQSGWLEANQTWWLSPGLQRAYIAESGPASWPRAASFASWPSTKSLPSEKVSDVKVGLQTISFHVSRVGVPTLVKISYYPRWHAVGAQGPYRVSPNLMAVIPTQKDVSLVYTTTPALTWGEIVSDLTVIAGLVVAFLVLRKRRIARR